MAESSGKVIRIDELTEGVAEVDVIGDGSLLVKFSLEGITLADYSVIEEMTRRNANMTDAPEFFGGFLANTILSWNLADRAGELIPITPEAIRSRVPLYLLMRIAEAIMAHVQPGNANGAKSRSGSAAQRRRR